MMHWHCQSIQRSQGITCILTTLFLVVVGARGLQRPSAFPFPSAIRSRQLCQPLSLFMKTDFTDMMSTSQKASEETLILSLSEHLGGSDSTSSKVHLILASQSPRRREILDMMGLKGKYSHTPSPLDESALQSRLRTETPLVYTRILAEEKAKALAIEIAYTATKPTLVLGSDTIVDLEEHILEKPKDEKDAKATLSRLSGRQHQVHTGVALFLVSGGSSKLVTSFTDTAQVFFAHLTERSIDAYIATKEPMDKAGSYGIQGIGGQFVSKVEGDFFTVMGLPMHRTSMALAEAIQDIAHA